MQVVTHYFSSVGLFNLCIFSMLIVMVASRSLLRMEQIPGKGRGLVASQLLKAGQIVLTESPSFSTQLLLSSHPLLHLTLTMTIVLESYLSLTIVLLSRALLAQTTVFVPRSASPLHSNPHTPLGYAKHSCLFNNTPIQHFFNNTPRTPSPSPFNCCFSQPLPS